MTPEFIDEAIVCGMIFAGFMLVLGIGGFIADYIFPHIPFIQNYIDSLPDYEDDEEVYQQFLEERRARSRARRHKAAVRKEQKKI